MGFPGSLRGQGTRHLPVWGLKYLVRDRSSFLLLVRKFNAYEGKNKGRELDFRFNIKQAVVFEILPISNSDNFFFVTFGVVSFVKTLVSWSMVLCFRSFVLGKV